jgi:SAM-dependent methyltransferase
VFARAKAGAEFVRRFGPLRFGREIVYQVVNRFHERRLGVRTAATVRLADIGIVSDDAMDSTPLGYRALFSVIRGLPVDYPSSVFLDYGAGKGRAVCVAATLPFRRVVGIDLSNVLIELARQNVKVLKHRRATQIDLLVVDATEFQVPPDANVIYFYNPFAGETLRRVIGRLRASFEQHPRTMYVIFFNNDHFDQMIAGERWITKLRQTGFYPSISCGVYEARP